MTDFIHKNRVEFAHTDMAGIVHFSEYFRYLEAAESAFFRSLGFSMLQKFDGEQLIWPRLACSFEFRAPLLYEDEFQVRLSIIKVGNTTITYEADVLCNGERKATGRLTNICCTKDEKGRLRKHPLPKIIREKICCE